MRRARGINRPGSFESGLLWTEMLEEANAITKENRDQMNLHLVQQTRHDVLLAGVAPPTMWTILSPAAIHSHHATEVS